MSTTEQKSQGYTPREQDLIRQLVQARLEQKSELGYESLESYELPPRTQFSMLNKPAVSIKHREMTFNMACIRLFEGVQFILPFTSRTKKRLAVATCNEEEAESVQWARINNKGAWANRTIVSEEYLHKIFEFMHWDPNCRYKVMGRVTNSDRGLILVFDLDEAILFTTPEEYVDRRTGEVKKRTIKYYPDEYKERIGKSYKDYLAKYQMSLFEQLSDYAEEDASDAVPVAITGANRPGEGGYYE